MLDRIIPGDDFPSACEAGVDRFILALWWSGSEPSAGLVAEGLVALGEKCLAAHGRAFVRLASAEQDAALVEVAMKPWFRCLCELAAEGYYADPGNGANPAARSWEMIGYRHGLPEGPAGPPAGPPADSPEVVIGKLRA
ncbi:gluconate 2-dehydrogenase subunit 3 family protein [Labrys sp. WJW]|uniref:gluconate 2-dehydrogenase subunit 3 family protein n=1 Tax=Labrys sp. WJW TaxID=1737983 RepID=UPI00138FEFDA|nr:gluconate 2-dehydrogenase subunit 3 family protein [Labrys sp. WJW]